jgi:hypothetical protein
MNSASFTGLTLIRLHAFSVLHICRMRFPNGIFMLFFSSYEIFLWDFMLFAANFSSVISWWEFMQFMLFCPMRFSYEIFGSLCDFLLFYFIVFCWIIFWWVAGGGCLIRVASMHYMNSIPMFEDDVTWPDHAIVIQGGSLGVWVGGVTYVILRMFAFFGLLQYSNQGSFTFFSCALTVNVIGLISCDSVYLSFRLQRRPQSVGCRESYHHAI